MQYTNSPAACGLPRRAHNSAVVVVTAASTGGQSGRAREGPRATPPVRGQCSGIPYCSAHARCGVYTDPVETTEPPVLATRESTQPMDRPSEVMSTSALRRTVMDIALRREGP